MRADLKRAPSCIIEKCANPECDFQVDFWDHKGKFFGKAKDEALDFCPRCGSALRPAEVSPDKSGWKLIDELRSELKSCFKSRG